MSRTNRDVMRVIGQRYQERDRAISTARCRRIAPLTLCVGWTTNASLTARAVSGPAERPPAGLHGHDALQVGDGDPRLFIRPCRPQPVERAVCRGIPRANGRFRRGAPEEIGPSKERPLIMGAAPLRSRPLSSVPEFAERQRDHLDVDADLEQLFLDNECDPLKLRVFGPECAREPEPARHVLARGGLAAGVPAASSRRRAASGL